MSRKVKALPKETFKAQIESFAHDGRGVTHLEGRAVFIDGALPGEEVGFVYTKIKREIAEGRTVEVYKAAPERVDAPCAHFGLCGACSLQHMDSNAQIQMKQNMLLDQLQRIGKVEAESLFEPLTGPHFGYRHKARLGVKWVHKKDKMLVGFREKSSAYLADLESCKVLHPKVGEKLRELAGLIQGLSIKEQVPQIEVAVGDESCALVFRLLADPTQDDLSAMQAFGLKQDFEMYIQRQGPDSIRALNAQPKPLRYALPAFGIDFLFEPTDFTQINVQINRKMVDRVMAILDPQKDETVLDLFCGLGNFTLPLAKLAKHAVGVEGSPIAIERAKKNALRNEIHNLEFHVADLSSKEVIHSTWLNQAYDKVLLDPARTGAEEILAYLGHWNAKRIVYVSCNPSTLARDAAILVHQFGYRLVKAGVMDMFPHTTHVESIAWFEKA